MKKILFILLLIILSSCTKQDDYIEKHELILIEVLYKTKQIVMYDTTSNNNKLIDYSYELFQMSLLQLCQIKGNPIFTFWFNGNNYYRL